MARKPTYEELEQRIRELEKESAKLKQVEEALKRSEGKYQTLFEAESDAIFIVDEETADLLDANEAALQLYGYSREEMATMKAMDLSAEPEKTKVTIRVPGKSFVPVRYHRKKDGTVFTVEIVSNDFVLDGRRLHVSAIRDVTALRQMELALRESEERFRRLYEQAPLGYQSLDKEGCFIDVNQAWLDLMGYSHDQVIGHWFGDFLAPNEVDAFKQRFSKFIENGEVHADLQMVQHAGSTITVHIDGRLGYDERGQFKQTHCILYDITERKRADEEIWRNENRLRSLVSILQYSAKNTQDFLDYALDEAIKLTGSKIGYIYHYSEERRQLVLNTWSKEVMKECSITKPQTCYELDNTGVWGEAVRQRKPIILNDFQANHPLKKGYPEGHAKLYKYLTVPIFMGERIVAVVGVANKESDYSEIDVLQLSLLMDSVFKVVDRKQAEEALRESEERLRSIMENAPDIIYTIGEDGSFTYINPAWEKILGHKKDEVLGKYVIDFMQQEDIKRSIQVFKRLREDKRTTINTKVEFIHKNGTPRYFDIIAASIFDSEGAFKQLVTVTRDITEQKELEAQLRQSQRMESIGTLAGGIAHDFNNLLSVIMGNAEMALDETPKTGPARYSLDQITQASHRARDLVKQILAFSRQMEDELKPVMVSSIIKEVVKFLRASLPSTIEIQQSVNVDRDTVLGDPTQIHQVLMNLCTNAHHAMLEQGGVLGITLNHVDIDSETAAKVLDLQPGSYLKLTVSDTGYGMPPEVMARIFDPYFTTKGKRVGTGLGLAVVHGIVKNLKGGITVQSAPGKGSTFEVLLPLIDEETVSEAQTYEAIPGGHERVLFVDDEEAITDLGKRMLQHLGYEVEVRTSSIEALEAFKAQPDKFDLVITDMTMPNMTGDRLARELMGIRPGIPVILCTGYSEGMTEEKAKGMGIKGFVMKPMVMREIAKAIRQALEKMR